MLSICTIVQLVEYYKKFDFKSFLDTPQGHHAMAFSQNNNGGILNNIYDDGNENSKPD